MKVICICSHCGERKTLMSESMPCKQYCERCSTKEKRDEVDKENIEIRKELEKNAS